MVLVWIVLQVRVRVVQIVAFLVYCLFIIAVIAHEELSAADPAFTLSYLAHSMLFVNNLARNGSHEQKLKYLPKACDGTWIGGMCMYVYCQFMLQPYCLSPYRSEPGAGTDVMGMGTTATLSSDGKHYVLNGTKMWITNGTPDGTNTGDIFLVYAKTGSGRGANDITSFLVEKGMKGFSLGQQIKDKCGMRASCTAELVFDNVHVPVENIVGSVGGATLCMHRNLQIERLTLAAMSLGIARRSIEVMNRFVTTAALSLYVIRYVAMLKTAKHSANQLGTSVR